MKIYAIGRMSKGAFVALQGVLTIRDASRAESMLRLQGRRGLKIAELESVADFTAAGDLKYERVLTPRARERISLGEYVDGDGLILYAVGLIGIPYIQDVEPDWWTQVFYGTSFFPTLREAWNERTAEINGAGEEDPTDYRVRELRVLAWISVGDDLSVVRSPIGPETPLEDEYESRREPVEDDGHVEPEEDYADCGYVPPPRRRSWSERFGLLTRRLMEPDFQG